MRIARSTPAQNPRGAAISRSIFRRGDTVSMTVIGHVLMRSLVAGEPASYDATDNCPKGTPDGCLVQGTLADRKSVVSGKSVSVRVDIGGRRIIKKKKKTIDTVD